ncbi:Hypothetical protein HVR_LOCUS429 [uncultured virus]|nr:Hypothetical protein HVR_LOCUS429 [uncultured virus]
MDTILFHRILKNTKLRLKEKYGWDDEFVDGAVDEYYRFMMLTKKYPKDTLVPGKVIDEVWHDHILHTQEYIKFCDEYFGHYVHHTPKDRSSNDVMKFDETESKYVETFGRKPPKKYWYEAVNHITPVINHTTPATHPVSSTNSSTTFSCCRCGN